MFFGSRKCVRCFFLRTLPFSLPGFEIQQVSCEETTLLIAARASSPEAVCPTCQQASQRVHSYYTRSPTDLPVSGQGVRLVLHVRRFRCQNRGCPQQTFVERVPDVVPLQARRTTLLPDAAGSDGDCHEWSSRLEASGRDGHRSARRYALTASEAGRLRLPHHAARARRG